VAFKIQNQFTKRCDVLYNALKKFKHLNDKIVELRADFDAFQNENTTLIDLLNETNRMLLDRANDSIRIGNLHSHAQKIVLEREEYIVSLVNDAKERDTYIDQLSDTVKERDRQLEHLNHQYMKMRTHWLVRLAIKQRLIQE
jgi:hypothetical protein